MVQLQSTPIFNNRNISSGLGGTENILLYITSQCDNEPKCPLYRKGVIFLIQGEKSLSIINDLIEKSGDAAEMIQQLIYKSFFIPSFVPALFDAINSALNGNSYSLYELSKLWVNHSSSLVGFLATYCSDARDSGNYSLEDWKQMALGMKTIGASSAVNFHMSNMLGW
jgi:hypothetical protein